MVPSYKPHKQDIYHTRQPFHLFSSPHHTFHVSKRIVCLPALQSSFSDRKSLQGFSPHRRWPFNTSLATANEPGATAAWLDPADFAQMFMSHSPAVPGWRGALQPWLHFPIIYLFLFVCHGELTAWNSVWGILWTCATVTLPFISSHLVKQTPFSMVFK